MSALPPNPVADADTQPFWDAVAEQRLVVQRCADCGGWIWQPRPLCPRCHAPDPEWTVVGGAGRLVSWTVIHPPVLPVWQDETPFTVLLVELDEGVRMVGRLVEGDHGELAIGDRVALRWHTAHGQTLPAWTPARPV